MNLRTTCSHPLVLTLLKDSWTSYDWVFLSKLAEREQEEEARTTHEHQSCKSLHLFLSVIGEPLCLKYHLKANGHFLILILEIPCNQIASFLQSLHAGTPDCTRVHTIYCTAHSIEHSVHNFTALLICKETSEIPWCPAAQYMELSHLESQQRKTWNLLKRLSFRTATR